MSERESPDIPHISPAERERRIVQFERELGMNRQEFLRLCDQGKEPDTYAAMALKHILLW